MGRVGIMTTLLSLTEKAGSGWQGMNNDYQWTSATGVGFVESLPDIANGEMTEIRIKYTAEKCE